MACSPLLALCVLDDLAEDGPGASFRGPTCKANSERPLRRILVLSEHRRLLMPCTKPGRYVFRIALCFHVSRFGSLVIVLDAGEREDLIFLSLRL